MPGKVFPDSLTEIVRDVMARVRRLEHRAIATGGQQEEFSYSGALALSTSTPWTPSGDCTLFSVRALLGTAGSSSTVVTVYVNGSSVGTVTLASSVKSNAATLTTTALVADTDIVTVGVTTVGTGAKDLTALVRIA